MLKRILAGVLLGSVFFAAACVTTQKLPAPGRPPAAWRGPEIWEPDIAGFAKADEAGFPPANAVLFMGSSSIRLWDLKKYFPGLSAVNRGFGGSYISDSAYYASRIAVPYKPRLILFYSGDNDIADNKPPDRLAADFEGFLAAAREKSPRLPVIYISIKPSPARWALWPKMREANGLIEASCLRQPPCSYLDVGKAMLDGDGKVRTELFMQDGLHLNGQGYLLWSALLTPLLN